MFLIMIRRICCVLGGIAVLSYRSITALADFMDMRTAKRLGSYLGLSADQMERMEWEKTGRLPPEDYAFKIMWLWRKRFKNPRPAQVEELAKALDEAKCPMYAKVLRENAKKRIPLRRQNLQAQWDDF